MARAKLQEEFLTDEVEADELLEKPTTEPEVEEPVAEEQSVEEDVPEKYRGKSMRDLVEMHQNAEKHIGKQSSEVGELRQVVDDFIKSQTSTTQQAPEQEDELDFFTDPASAVNRYIENHPKIKQAEEYTLQSKKASANSRLREAHPDMEQVLADPGFVDWVKASKIRTQLFVQADQQFDFDSADELLTNYKERQAVVQQTAAVDKQARKNTAKAANTGKARGTVEGARKKVYRRSDIIKLMKTDPQRYQAMSDEIFKAYAEGRVK